jgi:hypothetical protein
MAPSQKDFDLDEMRESQDRNAEITRQELEEQ